jgi:hypothetical protein
MTRLSVCTALGFPVILSSLLLVDYFPKRNYVGFAVLLTEFRHLTHKSLLQ